MTVSIRYRQYTHKTLVDYGRRSADCSRVSNIEAFGDADKLHAAEHSWQGQDDVSVHHASEWSGDGAADADQMAICSYVADNPILDFANNHGASILHDRTQASSPLGTQPLANNVSPDSVALQIETNSKALYKTIVQVMESYCETECATFYVSFVDENKRPLGAMMLDSGAQINIENDITCFIDYLKPSADKNAMLKHCGFGTRTRLFRDVDGNVYAYTD